MLEIYRQTGRSLACFIAALAIGCGGATDEGGGPEDQRALIFADSKDEAEDIAQDLNDEGKPPNIEQAAKCGGGVPIHQSESCEHYPSAQRCVWMRARWVGGEEWERDDGEHDDGQLGVACFCIEDPVRYCEVGG